MEYGAWRVWFKWHGVEFISEYVAWTYHLGPVKIMFGHKQGHLLQEAFEKGLTVGLGYDGFSREWMRTQRGLNLPTTSC